MKLEVSTLVISKENNHHAPDSCFLRLKTPELVLLKMMQLPSLQQRRGGGRGETERDKEEGRDGGGRGERERWWVGWTKGQCSGLNSVLSKFLSTWNRNVAFLRTRACAGEMS